LICFAQRGSAQIGEHEIEQYQFQLSHRRKDNGELLSVFSQRSALVPLRGYFRWLAKRGCLEHDPTCNMELPRPKQTLPKYVLTAHEAEAVLRQPDIEKQLGLRDRAMLEVLYSTGVRRMELANLRLSDVDRRRGLVFVNQGKWQKDRWVPISRRALDWVNRYRVEVRPSIVASPDDGTLFLTRNGLPFNDSWLSTTISRYVSDANLGKQGSCHLFRHTLATLMLENGADIRFIQAMLGHVDLKSTQIYAHVALKQLKKVHRRTHPGCRTPADVQQARQSAQRGGLPSAQAQRFMQAGSDSAAEAAARYLLLQYRLTANSHRL
jgi:integrase/recombinase XerD